MTIALWIGGGLLLWFVLLPLAWALAVFLVEILVWHLTIPEHRRRSPRLMDLKELGIKIPCLPLIAAMHLFYALLLLFRYGPRRFPALFQGYLQACSAANLLKRRQP